MNELLNKSLRRENRKVKRIIYKLKSTLEDDKEEKYNKTKVHKFIKSVTDEIHMLASFTIHYHIASSVTKKSYYIVLSKNTEKERVIREVGS